MTKLRVLKGYTILQSCDANKRLFLDNGSSIIPIDRDYYAETTPYYAKRVFVESSSAGGVIYEAEFAEMLVNNYALAKYVHMSGKEMVLYRYDGKPFNKTEYAYQISLRSVDQSQYSTVTIKHSNGVVTGEVWFGDGGGGGGGTIELSCDIETVYPIDKKYIPSTTFYGGEISIDNYRGFLYLDKERTVQASRKDVLEAYMHSNILVEILDGPVVIPRFSDISVAITLNCNTIVDSQESLLSYSTKEIVDFMTL